MNAAGPSWQDLWSNIGIFRDAIAAGALAGALLGFIGVHVVLRRMVFASSAIAQAAALGVALSFWVGAAVDPIRHAAGHVANPLLIVEIPLDGLSDSRFEGFHWFPAQLTLDLGTVNRIPAVVAWSILYIRDQLFVWCHRGVWV